MLTEGPEVRPALSDEPLETYITRLWDVLRHRSGEIADHSSLLPLPYPYVVPGGRFRELYYWDSFFIMLGLEADGRHDLALDLVKNFAFEIDSSWLCAQWQSHLLSPAVLSRPSFH